MSESYSVVAKLKAVDDGFSKVFGDAQSTVGSFNNKAGAAMAKVAGVVAVAAKAAGAAAAE
mgnify:FL=1